MTKKKTNVGRMADVRHDGQVFLVSVVNIYPDGKPRQVRVQTPGKSQGDVIMPGFYTLLEWVT